MNVIDKCPNRRALIRFYFYDHHRIEQDIIYPSGHEFTRRMLQYLAASDNDGQPEQLSDDVMYPFRSLKNPDSIWKNEIGGGIEITTNAASTTEVGVHRV